MLQMNDYKVIFAVVGILGIIIIASPIFGIFFSYPRGEDFTEFWILDQERKVGNFPFDISANEINTIYLGVGNRMEDTKLYYIDIKIRNQADSAPDSLGGTPSDLDPLFSYRVFLQKNEIWEEEIVFSIDFSSSENECVISKFVINGFVFDLNKVVLKDNENQGFFCQLFFELWIYDPASHAPQYSNQFVGIWMSLTSS
jgi:hypothetical protein